MQTQEEKVAARLERRRIAVRLKRLRPTEPSPALLLLIKSAVVKPSETDTCVYDDARNDQLKAERAARKVSIVSTCFFYF
jgi:hypothetical protein